MIRKPGVAVAFLAGLSACIAPMSTREAQQIANDRVLHYCNGHCGALVMGRTQKIRDRWLVDIDAPSRKFTVIVENDGNSHLDIWEK